MLVRFEDKNLGKNILEKASCWQRHDVHHVSRRRHPLRSRHDPFAVSQRVHRGQAGGGGAVQGCRHGQEGSRQLWREAAIGRDIQ